MSQSKTDFKKNWLKFISKRLWFITVMMYLLFVKWNSFRISPIFQLFTAIKVSQSLIQVNENFLFFDMWKCLFPIIISTIMHASLRISIWIKIHYGIRIESLWISISITNLIETVYISIMIVFPVENGLLLHWIQYFNCFFYVDSKQHLYQAMGKKANEKVLKWNFARKEMNNCQRQTRI